ncbi:MAG: hypothetical protein JWP17_2586 [Solirubrobacterales bacterium]|jgi:hypothetical protein|nr:hypothetical protein [Solirubrobacterales bacterium]
MAASDEAGVAIILILLLFVAVPLLLVCELSDRSAHRREPR